MLLKRNIRGSEGTILVWIILAVAVFLMFRSFGLYPVVMDDEYAHSKFSRLLSFDRAVFPDYLYYIVYRTTSSCGDSFLNCSWILNVLFFVSAVPFIYLIGSRITGKKTALLIAVLSLLGPANVYTAFFMPESMYFFAFWLLTWLFLGAGGQQGMFHWTWMGVIYGLVSLVKPHAIFLLPVFACMFVVFSRQNEERGAIKGIASFAVFLVAAIVTKLGISFLLAGKAGLTAFGPVYLQNVTDRIADSSHYLSFTRLILKNLQGHLLAISLLFSVPVAQALSAVRPSCQEPVGLHIRPYTAATLVTLFILAALIAASAVGTSPFETNGRLHIRYYYFALPLLLLVAVSRLSEDSAGTTPRRRVMFALPIGAAILYAIYTKLAFYTPNFVDSPDLNSITFKPVIFYSLGALSLFALITWLFRPRDGIRVFIYVFLPLSVAFSAVFLNRELGERQIPDVYDKAGVFARHYLSAEKSPDILVVGSDMSGMFRTLLQIDSPAAAMHTTAEIDAMGNSEAAKKMLSEKRWLLVFGNHSLPEETSFKIPMNGFTLAKISGPNILDFKEASWPGVITKASGLYPAEPWGTWSIGNVTLEFTRPLPEKFAIHLWGFTYGSLVGKEFTVHVGKNSGRFTLGPAATKASVIELDNPERSNTLTFDIPSTLSPKAAGLGDDDRILGVAFVKLIISPLLVKW